MHWIDYLIFAAYMMIVLGVGIFFFLKNRHKEDYYVGNREMKAVHVGLSVVATDVGGGFSIGLGGVGFMMGLAGSWLLFTGLIGAWFSAVFIIPRIKKLDRKHNMLTYPDFLRFRFNKKVALVAAIISGIGYLGFTGAQILAGAKLASATIFSNAPLGFSPMTFSLLVIAVITISYTVIGGLKAVIYTDTIQWIVLLGGLLLITLPVAISKIGGFAALQSKLPSSFFSFTNISSTKFINWMITIIPIWLIGMTLYQRIFACRDEKEAKKAWYIAGFFEYPVMAFTGVILGMCARVAFPGAESEMAMPMMISKILPVGITGIVIAAYFSAIMSTADSCLMASSGNFVNDVIQRLMGKRLSEKGNLKLSMLATLAIGVLSVLLAALFSTVLDAILYAYSFMVSGLFIPTLGAYFWKRSSSFGALASMIAGGTVTLSLIILKAEKKLPELFSKIGLDPIVYGILISLIVFIAGSLLIPDANRNKENLDG